MIKEGPSFRGLWIISLLVVVFILPADTANGEARRTLTIATFGGDNYNNFQACFFPDCGPTRSPIISNTIPHPLTD